MQFHHQHSLYTKIEAIMQKNGKIIKECNTFIAQYHQEKDNFSKAQMKVKYDITCLHKTNLIIYNGNSLEAKNILLTAGSDSLKIAEEKFSAAQS